MSPDAHKTARTAIYVVGGLMAASLVVGVIAVAVVAEAGTKAINQASAPPGPINAGTGAIARRTQINSQLMPGSQQ